MVMITDISLLALLAVDAEERESFAEEVGAEDLSVKELENVIRERDEARARVAELEAAENAIQTAKDDVAKAEAEAEAARKKLLEISASYDEEKENSRKLKEKLQKAKENPKIPQDKLDSIKREAEEAAKKEISESTGKDLEKARAALAAAENAKATAERARLDAEKRLADAEKRLKTASPEVNKFKTMFEALQDQALKCRRQIELIRESDAETADKLIGAIKFFGEGLINQWQ